MRSNQIVKPKIIIIGQWSITSKFWWMRYRNCWGIMCPKEWVKPSFCLLSVSNGVGQKNATIQVWNMNNVWILMYFMLQKIHFHISKWLKTELEFVRKARNIKFKVFVLKQFLNFKAWKFRSHRRNGKTVRDFAITYNGNIKLNWK